jgi:hypothetical protein
MSVDRFVLVSGHSTSRGVITGFDPKTGTLGINSAGFA